MKKTLCTATLFLGSLLSASAQNPSRAQGYLFFGPGAGSVGDYFGSNGRANIHIGAGGDVFIYKGFATGAEIGPVIPWSAPSGSFRLSCCFGKLVGLGSANLSYHFRSSNADRKLEPFATAGYSLFFRMGTWQGYNVGAGFDVWPSRKIAPRFDIRYHSSWAYNTMGFRAGLTFT